MDELAKGCHAPAQGHRAPVTGGPGSAHGPSNGPHGPVAEAPALEAGEELRSGPRSALALPHLRSPHLGAQSGHTWRLH